MKIKSKVLAVWLIVLCLIGFLWCNQDVSHANTTGVVTATSLNVRSGAGTSYSVLTTLANGTEVTIVETLDSWYKITLTINDEETIGYVSKQYIAIETAATATPTPTVAPTATPAPQVTYRNVTTYKEISVASKILKDAKLYKKDGVTRRKISKKYVTLKKGKSVKITGEKLIAGKKWFRITFTYKKKQQTAYVRNTYVKMTLKKSANAQIFNVKSAGKIRQKAGSKAAYLKVKNKIVKVPKGTTVQIIKDKLTEKKKWYKLSFTYKGKTVKGFLNSKYVKLTKKKITKKVAVVAMSEAEFEKSLTDQGFPESYKASLRVLHKKYPYWQFKAYRPGIEWSEALTNESKLGVNLISNSKSAAWKSKEKGAYDAATGTWKVFDGSTWVAASKEAIAYYMDPRNFLNERSIFQFESLEYQSQYQTKSGIKVILANTPFNGAKFAYKDLNSGADTTITYINAFVAAAKSSGVSPYHLASRVKQEVVTSATTTSSAVTGIHSKYPGIYNFYNIGATSSSDPVSNGLKWAKTGTTYLRPWTDRYRSIVGGAQYIGTSYINKGQNTVYLQKFNLTENNRYSHQYMTNVEAAYSEAIKTKTAYAEMMDQSPLVFSIPIFENMPETACAAPQ